MKKMRHWKNIHIIQNIQKVESKNTSERSLGVNKEEIKYFFRHLKKIIQLPNINLYLYMTKVSILKFFWECVILQIPIIYGKFNES